MKKSSPHSGDAKDRLLDELLVLRVKEGSREAWQLLVDRWQEKLWRHARRLVGSEDGAWDVMQDAWMAVARQIKGLRDPGALRRWLYTIVTRAAVNRYRRETQETAVASPTLDTHPAPEQTSPRDQAVQALKQALRQLPGEQQALLSMHYLEEFGIADLAEILGVPEGTVKSRLYHARQRVKQILERMES